MDQEISFRIRNVGAMNDAKLNLGDFTIIAGRNNTGKTHLVYTIYGFLRGFREILSSDAFLQFLEVHFKKTASLTTKEIAINLRDNGEVEWDIDEAHLEQERIELIQRAAHIYSKSGIANVFHVPAEAFNNASLEFDINHKIRLDHPFSIRISRGAALVFFFDGIRLHISLLGDDPRAIPSSSLDTIEYWLNWMYPYFLLGDPVTWGCNAFILSTHRVPATLFFREFDKARSDAMRDLQQTAKEEFGFRRLLVPEQPSNISRMTLPIHDNIDFARGLSTLLQSEGKTYNADMVTDVTRMIGGQYESEDNIIRFTSTSDEKDSFNIPMHLASSTVSEMTFLYAFLKYHDYRNDHLLIIDEPECHLDTANQIQLTRILTRIVNSGTKVLITTHSDYIIKEINNLIMLKGDFEEKEEVVKRLGYEETDMLSPTSVRAYTAANGGLDPCDINKFGIKMTTLDTTIQNINKVSKELASRLMIEDARE